MLCGAWILVNIGSDNGLVTDGTKPLLGTNVDLSSVGSCTIDLNGPGNARESENYISFENYSFKINVL